jgi:hypothetical protein
VRKLSLLIAALHAGALATAVGPGSGRAQDAAEVQAYMRALAVGTPEAMTKFLSAFPGSALPSSALGASIAATLEPPRARAAPRSIAQIAPAAGPSPQTGIY